MIIFVLFFLGMPLQTHLLDTGYFYFGNTNLIGVGPLEDGQKSGQWRVYSKIDPEDNPQSSLLQADPIEFEKNFQKEFPMFIMNFEEGIPNGSFLENYQNGKPKIITNMQDGIFDGEFGEFYESGEMRMTGRVIGGKKEGEWKEFLKSGEVISSQFYSRGVLEGRSVRYFPGGQINWEGIFKEGNLDGPYVFYLPDSTIKQKGLFANGVRVGEWLERLEIMSDFYRKGSYKNGFKEGEWQLVNIEGKFLQSEIYEQGKLISLGQFQTSSNVLDKGKVRNGRGQRYFYDNEGNILAKGKVAKGTENGMWFFYFPESNRISATGKLEGSERVGTWNFYSYDGEIIDQTKYEKYSQFAKEKESGNDDQNSRGQRYIPGITGSPSMDPFSSMQLNMNMMGQFLK